MFKKLLSNLPYNPSLIGQVSFYAKRLHAEEKIRRLQKQKGALAKDILGEENFARALSLEDFQFLLGEE